MLYDPTRGSPERRLLMKAAEYIEKHGWCRGVLANEKKSVCLVGSILKALDKKNPDIGEYHAAATILKQAVCRKMGKIVYIVDWNDAYCKDAADAAAMLRTAAMTDA